MKYIPPKDSIKVRRGGHAKATLPHRNRKAYNRKRKHRNEI